MMLNEILIVIGKLTLQKLTEINEVLMSFKPQKTFLLLFIVPKLYDNAYC